MIDLIGKRKHFGQFKRFKSVRLQNCWGKSIINW